MKKIAAIGLLVLLLYNTLGLTFAVFFFEKNFNVASRVSQDDDFETMKLYFPSLPYSGSWENDNVEGLLHENGKFYNATHVLHENDTLYVTLKSNQAARDQFFELVSMMEMMTDNDKELPESAQNTALKLFNDLIKIYVPNSHHIDFNVTCPENVITGIYQPAVTPVYSGYEINLNTPPPEIA
ncbi:hypothetical protein [Dyadobacter sp. NIV53]|uniref:hypothetical protein n=1 Tax=Dyadobacter sp. NIV53 TaxID=2861765 RepID=UPI001C882157|nr:hypothetical protein [Dyadobacter sp. NIV53]